MPIRPKNPVAAAPAPVVATPRARVRPAAPAPTGKVIRKVLTSNRLEEIEPGVRGCASNLSRGIPKFPHIHLQLRLPEGKPMEIEAVDRRTGELIASATHWEALEKKFGPLLPHNRWNEKGEKMPGW